MSGFITEARTGKGRRTENEDRYFSHIFDDQRMLLAVCDGMGGHAHGAVAAELALRTTRIFFISYYLTAKSDASCDKLIDQIENTFTAFLREKPGYDGMGTTLALAYAEGKMACCLWVGDTRIYHIRGDQVLFQSEDHNLGTMLVKNGIIPPNGIEYRSQRHILTQCVLGSHKPAEYSYHKMDELKKGDRIMVCSDGVTDTLDDMEIMVFLQKHKLKRSADLLEAECIERCEDNYTFVLGEIA